MEKSQSGGKKNPDPLHCGYIFMENLSCKQYACTNVSEVGGAAGDARIDITVYRLDILPKSVTTSTVSGKACSCP